MAQPLQTLTIQAPGFYGLNTQDSITTLPQQFALTADNCVIDQYGRVGARKGWTYVTTTNGDALVSIGEFNKADGSVEIISSSASAVYTGTETLTDITPSGYTVSDGDFQHATLNGKHYLFRENQKPLVYDGVSCVAVEDHADYSGTVPQGDFVVSAYGRLWVAKDGVVYWSDLLTGLKWDTGSSGSIDLDKVWPDGTDYINGLAAHNGFLIIFGKRQVLVYKGPEDPATMALQDAVAGIGCVSRDSIQVTGTDLLFLSDSGLRSFGRTIQEKSSPVSDLSINVRSDLSAYASGETGRVKSVYSPEEGFYLLHFPSSSITYCFDVRLRLENGALRATLWNSINPNCMLRTDSGTLYIGKTDGLAEYTGYNDNGETYIMNYFTNYNDFGNPANLKLLKNIKMTVVGGSNTGVTLNWGYDFDYAYKKRRFQLPEQNSAEFGVSEYNVGEYTIGVAVQRPSVNASGGGQAVQFGIEVDVNGSPISVQRMTAQVLIGRVL